MPALRICLNSLAVVLVSLVFALTANAQAVPTTALLQESAPIPSTANTPAQPVEEKILTNFVEAGGSYETLSNNFGRWSGGYLRGVVVTGKNTWNGEINGEHEFGDAGVYMAAGDTYNFNPDWYASLTLGSSAAASSGRAFGVTHS